MGCVPEALASSRIDCTRPCTRGEVWAALPSVEKQEVVRLEIGSGYPGPDGIACPRGRFKLDAAPVTQALFVLKAEADGWKAGRC